MSMDVKTHLEKVIAWSIRTAIAAIVAVSVFFTHPALAQVMSSGSYQIQNDSVNVGGGNSTSSSFILEDTTGEAGTGRSSSASFKLDAGYQQTATTSVPDTTAPSVPAGISASALSASSIRLTWTASTDDRLVTGYRIYRDGVFIGTASNTLYDDTGLSASTSYLYNVAARDAAGNVSGWSATTTGTTLAVAEPAQQTGSNVYVPLSIYDVIANASSNRIDLSWKTIQGTAATVSWGTSDAYELGSLSETAFAQGHSMTISGLIPGTKYFLRIDVIASDGRRGSLSGIEVRTLSEELVPSRPVTNVTGLVAEGDDDSIELTWDNPNDASFSGVLIARSEEFYPANPSEGDIVYDGSGEFFDDTDVEAGIVYYYTAFTRDVSGRYSSGAVASAQLGVFAEKNPLAGLPKSSEIHPQIEGLKLSDFNFVQHGKSLPIFGGNRILINGADDLTISLDYDQVPEVLKTIAVTLSHPDEPSSSFSFLLRINDDKTAYEATIAPLQAAGTFGMHIVVVDHKNRGMKELQGNVLAAVSIMLDEEAAPVRAAFAYLSFILIVLIIAISVLVLLIRKSRSESKKQHE